MLYPIEWLKELVDIKVPLKELAEILTNHCFEANLTEAFGQPCLDVEVLPNRGDCLSIIGLAREIAATTKTRLKNNKSKKILVEGSEIKKYISVEVKDKKLCPRYLASFITGVKISPSPEKIQKRLLTAGIRPINNVVDATNYVLLERGQPLHAFDADKITGGKIIVRTAAPDETIITLDGEKRQLTPEMLVIADAQKPVALAGIMGGSQSEVSLATKNILLESAFFQPYSIRKTSSALGLRTEASMRFEKGVDFENVLTALAEATFLIQEFAGGRIVAGLANVTDQKDYLPRKIRLRVKKTAEILGISISTPEIKRILESLGFQLISAKNDEFCFLVPAWRWGDIKREIDLIEEIARLYGYEKFPETLPKVNVPVKEAPQTENLTQELRNLLLGFGFNEAINFSLGASKDLDLLSLPAGHTWRQTVVLKNPLTEDQTLLCPTLLIGLLKNLAFNQNRQNREAALFEIGRTFLNKRQYEEELKLVVGIMKKEADFFEIKNILENILEKSGLKNFSIQKAAKPFLHPGQGAEIFAGSENLGFIGELHPKVKENFGLMNSVFILEISLEKISQIKTPQKIFKPLPQFPQVFRDLAVVVDKKTPYSQIKGAIKESAGEFLESVAFLTYYDGPQVPQGFASLAFSLVFRHPERTLKDGEVAEIHQKIIKTLEQRFEAKLR